MTAMFPGSGVPAAEATNSLLDPTTIHCDELWYSTSRCQPRFDPAAANAVLAELINLINKGEVNYDCNFLDQVQLAVRYLIQRALPCGSILVGGGAPSNAYTGTLDQPATRHNDFVTLRITPQIHNTGASTLNINGLGPRPILRNDGQPVKAFDLLTQSAPFPVPIEVIYYGGNWFCVGLVMSQVPSLRFGEVSGWVRTDGNDTTGDGTENSPSKAFRTIYRAYEAITSRYAPSPMLNVSIRLGIPGVYAGATLGPYGGTVSLTGDPGNRGAYLVGPEVGGDGVTNQCIMGYGLRLFLNGITFLANLASANWGHVRGRAAAAVILDNCDFLTQVNLPNGAFLYADAAAHIGLRNAFVFRGSGLQMNSGIALSGAQFYGANVPPATLTFENTSFTGAGVYSANLSTMIFPACTFAQSGCVGPQYLVTDNSIIRASGQTMPGNAAGVATEHGLYFP